MCNKQNSIKLKRTKKIINYKNNSINYNIKRNFLYLSIFFCL